MLRAIKRLFSGRPDNPPATEREIARAEEQLGVTIPEDLRRLYLTFNGVSTKDEGHNFRLMPLKEAVQVNRGIQEGYARAGVREKYSMRCFFTGEDCVGTFCAEPFLGWMFFLQHDNVYLGDESPVFNGLDSFLSKNRALASRSVLFEDFESGHLSQDEMHERLKKVQPDLLFPDSEPYYSSGMPVDFPTLEENDRTPNIYEECRLRLNAGKFDSEDERQFLIYTSVRMCPADRMEECEPFLHDEDTLVTAHVPRIMSVHDNPLVYRMFVRGATLESGFDPMPLHHLLARMALRNPDSKSSILAAYESENRDPEEFNASLRELIENPPVYF